MKGNICFKVQGNRVALQTKKVKETPYIENNRIKFEGGNNTECHPTEKGVP